MADQGREREKEHNRARGKFWFVFNPNQPYPGPTKRHYLYEDAAAEAERLAVKEKTEIFVLEVKQAVKPMLAPLLWRNIG